MDDLSKPLPTDPPWLALLLSWLKENTREVVGPEANPFIRHLYDVVGLPFVSDDERPWCGVAMGAALKLSGIKPPPGPARARNYLAIGTPLQAPRRGCIVVKGRVDPKHPDELHGHVTCYLGEVPGKPGWFLGVGGNQGNRVSVAPFDGRLEAEGGQILGWRWPGA